MQYRVVYKRKEEIDLRGVTTEDALAFFGEEICNVESAMLESKANENANFTELGRINLFTDNPNAKVVFENTVFIFRTNILRSMLERQVEWDAIRKYALKTERATE